jgi:hypothetical protein
MLVNEGLMAHDRSAANKQQLFFHSATTIYLGGISGWLCNVFLMLATVFFMIVNKWSLLAFCSWQARRSPTRKDSGWGWMAGEKQWLYSHGMLLCNHGI